MSMLVHEFVHAAVQRFADHTALVDNRGSLTYRQMWDRSLRLAAAFRGLGVQLGDRVVALMSNRNEWVETDNAASMVGALRGRLNARDSNREFTWVLKDVEPRVVVTGPEFTPAIRKLRDNNEVPPFELLGLGPGEGYEQAVTAATPAEPLSFSADEPYLVFHTSGTTGRYKGAIYSHRAWVNTYRNILALIMDDVTPDSALLHVGPLSHQSGILTAPGLFRGARSVMMEQFDPESFFDLVERERISHTILAPAIINALASHPAAQRHDISSLRRIYYSGAPIAPSDLRRAMDVFGPVFLQGYGSTEGGTIYNTILYPDEHVAALDNQPDRLSSCGKSVPFFDVKLADDDGQPVPTGEMGEIWVRGDAVSREYWQQPEATEAAYVDGWFRMGDLAVQDGEGYITIVDRKNDMIISGGLNVYPREVEDVVAAHPAVHEVAIIGVPDDKWGEAVKACVSLSEGASLDVDELQRHCKEAGLASYKKPLSLDIVDEIPKTAVGKLFRRALREPYWSGKSRQVAT